MRDPRRPRSARRLNLGRVGLEKDDGKDALFYFRSSLEKQTTDLGLLYHSVMLKLSGDDTAGHAQYERAINWAKRRSLAAKSHFEYFEALGRAHQAWGRLDEAIAAYTSVVDAVPRLGHGHRWLGEVYWLQGKQGRRALPSPGGSTADAERFPNDHAPR